MRTPARVAGHPVHPILVTFPIALWVFSFVCDLVFLATKATMWNTTAYLALGGGIVGGTCAAVPGLVDGLFLRKTPIFRTVLTHMALNSCALLIFMMSFLSRAVQAPFSWSLALSTTGLLPLALGGWVGGKLVFVQGVGVEPRDKQADSPERSLQRSA